jgi:hypothetical protein
MPYVKREHEPPGNPIYAVGGKSFIFFRATLTTKFSPAGDGVAVARDEPGRRVGGPLVPAGAVDHVEEGLAVQVPPEVLGEEPPEGPGHIRVTAGRDVRREKDLG